MTPVGENGEVDPLLGQVIAGKFRVDALLGAGGMGRVYRARQLSLDKAVVLKMLHPQYARDPHVVLRFQREARAASRLSHPNSITIFDFGQADDGTLFMAMELVQGQDLFEVLQRDFPLSQERLGNIMVQVCSALAAAHAQGIIHRDIKPENIMVEDRADQRDCVKVLDFGIARILDATSEDGRTLTQDGMVSGTPEYMSPEQARGEVLDARSDIYALGVLMYQLVTGELPFNAPTPLGVITKHLTDPVKRPSVVRPDLAISDGVERLILKCLEKRAEHRFQSAVDLGAAWKALLSAPHPTPRPLAHESATPTEAAVGRVDSPPVVHGPMTITPRNGTRLAIAACLAVGVLGGVGAWWKHSVASPVEAVATQVTPLAGENTVLACPPLLASGVDGPAGWLGAAAAGVACRRATAIMGGRHERTLAPAQLLDIPASVDEAVPQDLWDDALTRTRAVSAAAKRAHAWLDGTVDRRDHVFAVALVLRTATGQEIGRGSGEAPELYAAVRTAMDVLVLTGALPRAPRVDEAIAPWVDTADTDALVALVDLESSMMMDLVPSAGECERVRRVLPLVTHRAAVEARCAEARQGNALAVPAVPVDHASPAALAVTAVPAVRYGTASEGRSALAAELRGYIEQATNAGARAELEVALLDVAQDDPVTKRMLALRSVQDNPRNPWTWSWAVLLSQRQKGADVAARAWQAWVPEHPDAWNAVSCGVTNEDLQRRVVAGRRATTLAPSNALFAINQADNLLASGRVEEARTMAAHLSGEGPLQRAGAEAILGKVEMHEGLFAAALARAQRALRDRPEVSGLETSDFSLLVIALDAAVILGKEQETADELAKRFVLADPPLLDRYSDFTTYGAGLVCLHSSKKVMGPCVSRVRRLMAADYFTMGHTAQVPRMLDGLASYAAGNRADVVRLWRPLGLKVRGVEMRTRAFEELGESDVAEQMDRDRIAGHMMEVNGVSFAHVREARRAEKRGDREAACRLAGMVVDAWAAGDADVPAVGEMRKVLARCQRAR